MATVTLRKDLLASLIVLVALSGGIYALSYPYKACHLLFSNRKVIWVTDGKCTQSSYCETLVNCTTFKGSIIVREAIGSNINTTIAATFPALREITGYLVILYFRKPLKANVFPNLAVIRGQEQIVHYSLVFYRTFFEKVGLPSLTVIKSGGVRFDHNSQMCYIKTVKWRSIVLDKEHTKENFGISFYRNNDNCFDKCLDSHCVAPSGHDSSRQSYCFGPGNSTNPECQKLCKASCGPHGCPDGKWNQCCHKDCLGGCSEPESNRHCFACMKYRLGNDGTCVSQCPAGQYIVDDFECRSNCPFAWFLRYYKHEGKCVRKCPAGFAPNATRQCYSCQTCERVCSKRNGFKIDGLSSALELSGCTNVTSNIEIEIRAGPNNIMQRLEESLGKIRQVDGYVKVTESEVITSLNFLKNLRFIRNSISEHTYGLLVMSNSKLTSLWKPGALTIGNGNVLFHGNINLCQPEIDAFNRSTYFIKKGAFSQSQNGYLCPGNLQKFNITVQESICSNPSTEGKCVQVIWDHDRTVDSRSNFFIVHYRISHWTVGKKVVEKDNCSKRWCRKDIDIPKPSYGPFDNGDASIKVLANITNLIPFTTYKFYVEMYSLATGNGRRSYEVELKLTESVPGIPIGLKAAYLSTSELEVSWQPPESPNGVLTEYRIYYDKKDYSFWNTKLDWCSRMAATTSSIKDNGNTGGKNGTIGSCPTKKADDCVMKEKESQIIKEDKNFILFSNKFENALIGKVFQKKDDDDPDISKPISSNNTTTATPMTELASSPCGPHESSCDSTEDWKNGKKTSFFSSVVPTMSPTGAFVVVSGISQKYVIKNLTFYQEYNIRVCPCNVAGCVPFLKCPNVFGQTDVNSSADNIPDPVIVDVQKNEYFVNWTAPRKPNGVVLFYDIRIRHNQNEEKQHCSLGHLPTTFFEKGVAPGNYSIRIQVTTPAGSGAWSPLTSFNINEQTVTAETSNAVVIGVGCASAAILLLIAAFLYVSHQRRKAALNVPTVLYASDNPDYFDSSDVYVPDEWEVPRDKIELLRELGKGSFGMVFEGIAYKLIEDDPKLRVAVKTVNDNASMRERVNFLQEASIMKAFDSYHIVRLLGIVSQGQPTLVVMELMERGDLKGFLRSRRPATSNSMEPPNLAEILQMAAEIADGMSYLAARKFVHRDLAARNCMVAADFTVKIGDFGMTRDVYDTDYYRKGGKGLLPVRWMAPESLYDGLFTTSSDVWSYGIVLWEIATLAAQPYPGKSNEDVLSFIIDGGILEQPDDCPDRLYNMMCNCWKAEPKARPSFLEIVQFLENDVSEGFEEVSYYHEMKRRLLELTNTASYGTEQANNEQTRRFFPLAEDEARVDGDAGNDNWMTEADRNIGGCQVDICQGAETSGYSDNVNDGPEIRYVQFPMK